MLSLVSLNTKPIVRSSQGLGKKSQAILFNLGPQPPGVLVNNGMASLHLNPLLTVLMLCQDNRLKKDNFESSYQSILTTLCWGGGGWGGKVYLIEMFC